MSYQSRACIHRQPLYNGMSHVLITQFKILSKNRCHRLFGHTAFMDRKTFKFVHLLASVTFNAPYFHYIIQTIEHVSIPKDIHFRLSACFVHAVAQFSRILNFHSFIDGSRI